MKRSFRFAFCFFAFGLLQLCYAGEGEQLNQISEGNGFAFNAPRAQLSARYFNPLNSLVVQDSLSREQRLAQLPGYKLPKRALFFSALIPGTGELYAKSYIKAGVFFLAEVAAWTVYGSYTQKGKNQEKKYQEYADAHWDPNVWQQWKQNYANSLDDAHASTMEKYLSGDKMATTKQQYYEMIGKYPAFYVGWDFARYYENQSFFNTISMDSLEAIQQNSSDIGKYMDMRDKSNQLFRIARTATNYVIVNHILSAIDAAWTAKRHNNKLLEASIRVKQIFYVDQFQPVMSLELKW
ncbi:MAG: hypothetical protein ONB31_08305 [candidate division KSB1 bacterium]|nr:hypothetical protein [candidate division KSB1 bacterium]MDZ7335413.1 hypothetical protein [candidate division KSB1 bacterium]MDZ7358916.1 hypothetical protein [candidate division KSB1 bacterium]MDZ7401178.1 hypothetical protein [candidate division KSB1 bacterium]